MERVRGCQLTASLDTMADKSSKTEEQLAAANLENSAVSETNAGLLASKTELEEATAKLQVW